MLYRLGTICLCLKRIGRERNQQSDFFLDYGLFCRKPQNWKNLRIMYLVKKHFT